MGRRGADLRYLPRAYDECCDQSKCQEWRAVLACEARTRTIARLCEGPTCLECGRPWHRTGHFGFPKSGQAHFRKRR